MERLVKGCARLLGALLLVIAFDPLGGVTAGELTVVPRMVQDLKAVFATVESAHEAAARVRIGGTIRDLAITEGDGVAAGQVLATVRDPKLPLQLAALEARLRAIEAQERQAALELGRAKALRASGTGSQQRFDDARAAVDVVTAQAAAMRAERAVVEQQMREGAVLAPVGGRILALKVVEGSVVVAGEPVAIIATGAYVLRLRLPERHARFIKDGDAVLIGDHGLAPVEASSIMKKGEVVRVYPRIADGLVTADVRVAGLGDYFVGERVRVYVATGSRRAVVVPRDYVARRFGADFVRLVDGTAVPVQIGGTIPNLGDQPGGIEVLSGLHAGDAIVPSENRR